MGVGIDEARQDDFAGAVNFYDVLAVLRQPGIAQSVFAPSGGNNFAPDAQHSAIFNDAERLQFRAASWTRGGGTQGKKLTDIDQQHGLLVAPMPRSQEGHGYEQFSR